MKIGVIGSGNMGRSIGILLAERGHQVFFGARNPTQGEAAARLAGRDARSGTNQEAAEFGETLLWGVRGVAASDVVPDLSAAAGKVIVDMNNNETRTDGGIGPLGDPLAVRLQAELPGAHVIKAFNTLPMEVFEVPAEALRERKVSVFVAGDDLASKRLVSDLVASLGFHPIDFGSLRNAGMLEGLSDVVRTLAGLSMPFPFVLSVVELPSSTTTRLGGRQMSALK